MEKLNRLLIVLLAIMIPREVYPFGKDCIVAETAVKNYRFMNEVADVIKSTGKITDAGKDILANSDCFYEIRVSSLVDKDFGERLSYNSLPFYPNGSYMLSITYADFSSIKKSIKPKQIGIYSAATDGSLRKSVIQSEYGEICERV